MVKWWYNTGIRFHNLIGLFIVPITEELGFSRSAFTGTMTISMFSSIAMNLALGAVLAHTKRRPLFVASAVLTAVLFG